MDHLIRDGYTHVVDADLQGYFDSIPHEPLMQRVEERISDGRVLGLVRSWLGQDILRGLERWTPPAFARAGSGTPQGAVVSPLLANIYLHPLDQRMAALGHRMVRYADDFVVLCSSREEADAALVDIRRWVAENGLCLHPDKTHLGPLPAEGGGFRLPRLPVRGGTALGPQEEPGPPQGRHPGEDAADAGADSLARIVADLNPMLRGWFGYFKHAHPYTFKALDGFVRRRLRARLRKQKKRPGFGRCLADQKRWNNAFFADAGLFALHTAWLAARHPRCGNHRLESRMRENRTCGSEGGEGDSLSRPLSRGPVPEPAAPWMAGSSPAMTLKRRQRFGYSCPGPKAQFA